MDAIDLNRYEKLLLAKRRELLAARAEAVAPVPGTGERWGVLLTKQPPILKQRFKSACAKPRVICCERPKVH